MKIAISGQSRNFDPLQVWYQSWTLAPDVSDAVARKGTALPSMPRGDIFRGNDVIGSRKLRLPSVVEKGCSNLARGIGRETELKKL